MVEAYAQGMADNILKMRTVNIGMVQATGQQGKLSTVVAGQGTFSETGGGLSAMVGALRMLGLVQEDSLGWMNTLIAGLTLIAGVLQLYEGVRLAIKLAMNIEAVKASLETGVAIATQNYTALALAALGASMVIGAFATGVAIGTQNSTTNNSTINNAETSTPAGRRNIASHLRGT